MGKPRQVARQSKKTTNPTASRSASAGPTRNRFSKLTPPHPRGAGQRAPSEPILKTISKPRIPARGSNPKSQKINDGPRVPKLCRQRGQNGAGDMAYITVGGQRSYLGPWGSQQAHERYGRTLAELLAHNGQLLPSVAATPTITEVVAAYLVHAETYYGPKHGTTAGIAMACKPLKEHYGSVPAENFRPCDLLVLQALYVKSGNCRTQCNRNVAFVRRLFKWATSRGMVSLPVYQAACTVEGLRRGHTAAPEGRRVLPVAWETVAATLPHLSRPMRGLVLLLWHTGARPGELVGLRAIDIDTRDPSPDPDWGPVWRCDLEKHKTAHSGRRRVLWFGREAQEVLRDAMSRRGVTDVLFSPQDTLQERSDTREGDGRRGNQLPTPRETDRTVGEQYHPGMISRAIDRAVATRNRELEKTLGRPLKEGEALGHWFAYQLRHSFATRARVEAGIEVASASLGHASIKMTEVYAEKNEQAAKRLALKIG